MKRRRIGLSVVVLALVFVAGCGSGAGDPATLQGSDLTRANFATTVADAQAGARTVHVQAQFDARGQQFSMVGDVAGTGGDVALDLTVSGAMPGEARFLLVDRVIYLKVPGLSPGDKFLRFDLARSNHPAARMFDQLLTRLNQLDPSRTAESFKAITRLERTGTAEVGGVQTTRYAVTVDTRKALRVMGMADMVPPRARIPETIDQVVWLDGEHRLRRLRMNLRGMTMDMTFSRWGEPVEITAPPAGQTTEMPRPGRMPGSAPSARG